MQPQIYDSKQIKATDKVTLTAAALQHVEAQINKNGKGIGIRLATKKSGCSGYAYVVDIIEHVAADDHVFPVTATIVVVVKQTDFPMVKGTEIDFVREGLNSHFVYRNPNESGSCGCGESFSV